MGATASLIASPLSGATAQADPAPAPAVKWEPCPATVDAPGAQCGQVPVPMRYGDPQSPQISVGFVRVPAAQPEAKRGVLFGNPGGPGGDGYTYVGSNSVGFSWPQEIRNEWDMVAVQPRGLQHSTPLECEPAAPANQLDAVRNQVESTVNTGAMSRRMCQKGNPGMPESVTTENNARDWEMVRRALGYDTISIMGLSYGTYLGSAYATMYPAQTDKVVLDSAMNPSQQWNTILNDQKGGYERALHDYFNFVARNDATYHMGDTPLKAYQYWSAKVVKDDRYQSHGRATAGPRRRSAARVGVRRPGRRRCHHRHRQGTRGGRGSCEPDAHARRDPVQLPASAANEAGHPLPPRLGHSGTYDQRHLRA